MTFYEVVAAELVGSDAVAHTKGEAKENEERTRARGETGHGRKKLALTSRMMIRGGERERRVKREEMRGRAVRKVSSEREERQW